MMVILALGLEIMRFCVCSDTFAPSHSRSMLRAATSLSRQTVSMLELGPSSGYISAKGTALNSSIDAAPGFFERSIVIAPVEIAKSKNASCVWVAKLE